MILERRVRVRVRTGKSQDDGEEDRKMDEEGSSMRDEEIQY